MQLQAKYPVYKMMTNITIFYAFSEFELILFIYCLSTLEAPLCNSFIISVAFSSPLDFMNILPFYKIEKPDEYKKVVLWMLIIGYTIKQETTPASMKLFESRLNKLIRLKEFYNVKEANQTNIKYFMNQLTVR